MSFIERSVHLVDAHTIQNILLGASLFLAGVGILAVFSGSAILAEHSYGDMHFFLKKQVLFILLSGMLAYICYSIRTEFWDKYATHIYVLGIVLLVVVLLPGIGKSAGGSTRWLALGPLRLQPGELFKISMIVFLASSLARRKHEINSFAKGLVPHLLIPGVAMLLLMMEPDFGSTFLVGSIAFIILFLSGARIAYLLGIIMLALPIGFHLIASSPYRLGRIMAFLDPWAHRQDIGYQVVQSLITFGSGRWFGLGLGQGTSKLFFLPAAHTDFILAVIGEEAGFIAVALVLLAFLLIALCGFRIAATAVNRFSSLFALGLTSMLIFQAVFNCFVVMGLAPTKGVTLPFISYGGSSLIVSAAMIGILLRINQEGSKGA